VQVWAGSGSALQSRRIWLAATQHDDGLPLRDILLPRLHALLARAHGDAAAYAHFRDRYRDMVRTLGYEGHIAWAEAMP
jgi:hypothetical protein